MEINGTCIGIITPTEFTSRKTGAKDNKCGFVLECKSGDFTNKVMFYVWGQEKFNAMGIVVGGTYNVAFELSSREYQGRWYTDATAWRAARLDNGGSTHTNTQSAPQPQPQPTPAPTPSPFEAPKGTQQDIPF